MADSIHSGHRKRLKNQYVISGAEGMSDITLLELMLFFAIPQGDTNPLSHRLLDRFGSFDRVLEANFEELKSVDGIGDHAAVQIMLFQTAMQRYYLSKANRRFTMLDKKAISDFLHAKYIGEQNERAMILLFNANKDFVNYKWLNEGNLQTVSINARSIAAAITESDAKHIILVHNHPSGLTSPSVDDIESLLEIGKLVKLIGAIVVDNVIYTENDVLFFSTDAKFSKYLLTCLMS